MLWRETNTGIQQSPPENGKEILQKTQLKTQKELKTCEKKQNLLHILSCISPVAYFCEKVGAPFGNVFTAHSAPRQMSGMQKNTQ